MLKKIINKLMFKKEFKNKCLKTTPCHCCAYWSIRKSRCELQTKLESKYELTRKSH